MADPEAAEAHGAELREAAVELRNIAGEAVARLQLSPGETAEEVKRRVEEAGGPPPDQQRLILPSGDLLRDGEEGARLLAAIQGDGGTAVLTMVVMPSIQEEGRRLIAKYGWTSYSNEDWLIAHQGHVYDTPCERLGEEDFRALLRFVQRSRWKSGYGVRRRDVSPFSTAPGALIPPEELDRFWDDFVAGAASFAPEDSGLALYDKFLEDNGWKQYDMWD
mmetsp:Transcript_97294/g.208774  ORF Transcript_97294/g.208774 Transcript_97294/m.208774 type:complete len:220 (-) Transcript_97294:64-723(-)